MDNNVIPNEVPNLAPEVKKFNPVLIALLVLLLVVISVASGYFFGKNQVNVQSINRLTPTPIALTSITSPIPTQTLKVDETANWKTYESKLANYSFKYPESIPLESMLGNSCSTCVEELHFTPNPAAEGPSATIVLVFKDSRIKTLEDYRNIIIKGDSSIINIQNAKIGSENAYSYKLSGGITPLPVIEYVTVKNNFYYIVRLVDNMETNKDLKNNQIMFDQILTTFKFTQ